MNLAALIVSIVAIAVSTWSVNHQRLIYRWTLDRYKVAMPKLWHVRYHRSTAPVVLANAETAVNAVKIQIAGIAGDEQFRNWLKKEIRRQRPGDGTSA